MINDEYSPYSLNPKPHICPCCGKYMFPDYDSFDICPVCSWEDDFLQEKEPDLAGGANEHSLNEWRQIWLTKLKPEKEARKTNE